MDLKSIGDATAYPSRFVVDSTRAKPSSFDSNSGRTGNVANIVRNMTAGNKKIGENPPGSIRKRVIIIETIVWLDVFVIVIM